MRGCVGPAVQTERHTRAVSSWCVFGHGVAYTLTLVDRPLTPSPPLPTPSSLPAPGLRVLTIHNNPEDLTLAPGVKHLRQVLADTDSADISQYFNAAYEFINEGVQKQQRE